MPVSRCSLQAALALTALTLALPGCAAREPAASKLGLEHPVWTNDGLYLVDQKGAGALFLAPPALGLRAYSRVIIEDIAVGYKQGVPPFEPREAQRLVDMVGRNALRFLASHGWERAHQPGPDTLRLRIAISDIDVQPSIIRGAGSALFHPSGGASIVLELRDSTTAKRIFLYGQRRQLPPGAYGGPGHIEAERVADAFYEYAKDLVRAVERASEGEYPAPQERAALTR